MTIETDHLEGIIICLSTGNVRRILFVDCSLNLCKARRVRRSTIFGHPSECNVLYNLSNLVFERKKKKKTKRNIKVNNDRTNNYMQRRVVVDISSLQKFGNIKSCISRLSVLPLFSVSFVLCRI